MASLSPASAPPRPARRATVRRVTVRRGLVVALVTTLAAVVTALVGTAEPAFGRPRSGTFSIWGSSVPPGLSAGPASALELGTVFTTTVPGYAVTLRFYQGPGDTGPHTGRLWSPSGQVLATVAFPAGGAPGWHEVALPTPVALSAASRYVVSYTSAGSAVRTVGYFQRGAVGNAALVATGGVTKAAGAAWSSPDTNAYLADLVFRPDRHGGGRPPSPTSTTSTTSSTTTTTSPSSSTTTSPTSSTTSTTTPPSSTTTTPAGPLTLNLPRVPWEGGASYYAQFPVSAAGGWADPAHFPVAIWWDVAGSDAEAQFDKSQGLNSYVQTNPNVPYSVFADNGMSWIGDKLNSTFPDTGTAWGGNFLGDEIDGQYDPATGQAVIRQKLNSIGNNGRFSYANYTAIVASNYNPTQLAADDTYVNMFEGPVSVDAYWYTDTHCSDPNYRDWSFVPVSQQYCRTASSYGKTVKSVRARDASDGKLKPVWAFVELMGGGTETTASGVYITPEKIQGAVMDALINEARGIIYFNQSFQGTCQGGNLIRLVQTNPSSCAAANVQGMSVVNHQIQQLAPVLNTQSYDYSPGAHMDTMLKTYGDSIYLFAMVDGASDPGARSFQLPPGVSASSAQVMFENRTVAIDPTGHFTDTFAKESTYHIYKITPTR